MFRATRMAVSAILALALAALPVVLGRCAESCEAHDFASTAPTCHHAASPGVRLSHAPIPCGHDHNGTGVASAKTVTTADHGFDSIPVVPAAMLPSPLRANLGIRPHSPPASPPALDVWSLPLRI